MRFEAFLARQESGELSQAEAGGLLGGTERTFRRWRDRHREDGGGGLVVTLDDATSAIYSAFLVAEEGTASTLRGLGEVIECQGLARRSPHGR